MWFAGWTAGLVSAIGGLPDADAIVWLCFALPAEGLVLFFIAWVLFGRTVLTASADVVELERAVGRYVRSRRYQAPLVDRVGVTETEENGYSVRISYRGKDVNLLSALSAADAETIASSVDALLHPRSRWDDERPQTRRTVPVTREPKPSARKKGVVLICVAVTFGAIGVVTSLLGTKSDSKTQATTPTVVPQASAMPPNSSAYPNPAAYASAMTSWALGHGASQLVTQPQCDAAATWTHWSCAAVAQSAGRRLRYRCEAAPSGGFTCRLDTN